MGNALEALRIAATYFVLLYHAALSYLARPLRLTLWASYDASGHAAFDHFVYWVNGFAMPLFFLAAGVSAPAACASRGPRVFLTSRVRRLLRPLLFACLTILPFFYLVWGYGLLLTDSLALDDILRWRFSPAISHYLYGLGHFWFLEYLFLVSVLWCGGWTLRRYLFRRSGAPPSRSPLPSPSSPSAPRDGIVERVLASRWRPFWLAIPTALIFCVDSDTMLRVDNTIVPNVFRLLHYSYFFTVGGWISRTRDPRGRFVPGSTLYLLLSFVAFGAMSPLLLRHAAAPLEGWSRLVYCLLAATFPWLTVFGGLGVFMRVFHARGPLMRYLAESSFWVYLVHVPVVALLQIILLGVSWPIGVKFLLVAAVAIAASLASYEWIVRRSLVGEIINGTRKRTTRRGLFGPEFGWIATLALVAVTLAGGAWYWRTFFWGDNLHQVIPGQLYRCARLSSGELESVIRRQGVRTVITFTGGGEKHLWYVAQKQVCQAHGVTIEPINLRGDEFPARKALVQLVDTLDRSPRPILVQANRGIDQSGLAAALGLMLSGTPPREALGQFGLKYFQIDGAEHSTLGRVVLEYRDWLDAQRCPHSAERLRMWVHQEYVAHSVPSPRSHPRPRSGVLARTGDGRLIVR